MQAFSFCCRYTRIRSSSAPSTDAVGDAMQGLEIVPLGELVVFGCWCDVRAHDAHGKVWDVVEIISARSGIW
jgi:hypothetical protein